MTTIRHCSILEFGKGESTQAVAPGITRPLHATAVGACILMVLQPVTVRSHAASKETYTALHMQFKKIRYGVHALIKTFADCMRTYCSIKMAKQTCGSRLVGSEQKQCKK